MKQYIALLVAFVVAAIILALYVSVVAVPQLDREFTAARSCEPIVCIDIRPTATTIVKE